MGMLDTLLGRKKRTAATIAEEITKQERAISEGHARIERARAERKAAIEAFDDVGHRAADEELAAAGRDIERREHAIELLKTAHAERDAIETREAFQRSVEEAMREAAAIEARIDSEYRPAAEIIGKLMSDIRRASGLRKALAERAEELEVSIPEYKLSDGVPYAVGNLPRLDGAGGYFF